MRTYILGHRGSKGTAPENTLVSFQHALASGCDGIELDVHLSRDNVPVVIHDEWVDRTTDKKGLVQSYSVDELKTLDAGSWFHQRFKGEQVPTLEEVLKLLQDRQFNGTLNIELKTDRIAYERIEQIVLELVHAYKPRYRVVYSSFNYQTLERLLAIDPDVDFGILFGRLGLETKTLASGVPVKSWHARYTLVNRMIRQNTGKVPLRLWTVNSLFDLAYCMSKNVDTIITDYPKRAMKVRKQLQGE